MAHAVTAPPFVVIAAYPACVVSPPPRRYAAVVVLELDDGMLLALLNLYVFKCNEVSVLYTAACQPNALARSFSFGAPACSD